MFTGAPQQARRAVLSVLAASLGASMGVAAVILLFHRVFFTLLLGANNTVPTGAGPPAALIVFTAVAFAAGNHLMSHTDRARAVRRLAAVAVAGALGLAAVVLFARLEVMGAIWTFALSLTCVSLVAVHELASGLRTTPSAETELALDGSALDKLVNAKVAGSR
jgi:hypothetical protein